MPEEEPKSPNRLLERIRESQPVQSVENFLRSRTYSSANVDILTLIRIYIAEGRRVDIDSSASAICFKLMMAMPPLLLFFFTLLPYLPLQGLEDNIYFILDVLFSDSEEAGFIYRIITDFITTPRTGLLSLSLVMTFYLASNGVYFTLETLDDFLEVNVKETTNWKRRLKAFQLLIFYVVIAIMLLVLVIGQHRFFEWLVVYLNLEDTISSQAIYITTYILLFVFLFSSLGIMYHFGPSVIQRWKFFNPGVIISAIGIVLFSVILYNIAHNFVNYNQIYGTVGSLFLGMIWLQTTTKIILMGFTLNITLDHIKYKIIKDEG